PAIAHLCISANMAATATPQLRSSTRMWGLGWCAFYVLALYAFLVVVLLSSADKPVLPVWLIMLAVAVTSALAVAREKAEPRTIYKSILYALHLLSLVWAVGNVAVGLLGFAVRIFR